MTYSKMGGGQYISSMWELGRRTIRSSKGRQGPLTRVLLGIVQLQYKVKSWKDFQQENNVTQVLFTRVLGDKGTVDKLLWRQAGQTGGCDHHPGEMMGPSLRWWSCRWSEAGELGEMLLAELSDGKDNVDKGGLRVATRFGV